MAGMLYLVGTPIGNLEDLSPRARRTLEEADFIAAEDTRVTLKLLNHFSLRKPLVSYYEHNKKKQRRRDLPAYRRGRNLRAGHRAGMPCLSDPGADLVRLCAENGIPVTTVPGPSAAVSALVLSGLDTGRFTFEGFLSTANKKRVEHLSALRGETRTMIFYEAPHKLLRTLQDFETVFGPERRIALCRELTKVHEEVRRTTVGEALRYYSEEAEPAGGRSHSGGGRAAGGTGSRSAGCPRASAPPAEGRRAAPAGVQSRFGGTGIAKTRSTAPRSRRSGRNKEGRAASGAYCGLSENIRMDCYYLLFSLFHPLAPKTLRFAP